MTISHVREMSIINLVTAVEVATCTRLFNYYRRSTGRIGPEFDLPSVVFLEKNRFLGWELRCVLTTFTS